MKRFRLVLATALAALVVSAAIVVATGGPLDMATIFLVLALVAICIRTLSVLPWRGWASSGARTSSTAAQPVVRFIKEQLDPDGTTIIGRDKLKHYSVADELLKWTELHEKGVVTGDEFRDARQKILKRED